jgi:hypothetical protein
VKNQADTQKAVKRRKAAKILKNPTKYMMMPLAKRKKRKRPADNTKPFVTYAINFIRNIIDCLLKKSHYIDL